jgi:hypothetical protein
LRDPSSLQSHLFVPRCAAAFVPHPPFPPARLRQLRITWTSLN